MSQIIIKSKTVVNSRAGVISDSPSQVDIEKMPSMKNPLQNSSNLEFTGSSKTKIQK